MIKEDFKVIWIGIIIVIVTFYAIIKNYETRTVLIISGLIMAAIGGQPMASIDAFLNEFANPGLVPVICAVMGFSYVMDYTGCSKHLVTFTASGLKHAKFILIPGTVMLTFMLGIALPSASGLGATVGAIMIPLLIKNGIHPAMAASAVFLGTWGCVITPGNMFNIQVADMAKVDPVSIMIGYTPMVLVSAVTAALVLTAIAYFKKEGPSSQVDICEVAENKDFKINYVKAFMPILPIVLLVLADPQIHILPFKMNVQQAMVICTMLAFLVTRSNYVEFAKKFFKGAGDSFCEIICIIAAAAMFTKGMQVIGLTGALTDIMKNSQGIAQIAAGFGPFIIAVISGSGNAATLAFNGAVTPHAAQFGFTIVDMGTVAQIAGQIGRSMSPVAGVTIICAKMAGVNPVELTKRNALPTIIAAIIITFTLL